MIEQSIWQRTQALLARGQKQQARSVAHAAMDSEAPPGGGTAASAAVAHAEGFDELAAGLLRRLEAEGAIGALGQLRLAVDLALGVPATEDLRRARVALPPPPPAGILKLVGVAARCGRMDEFAQLVAWLRDLEPVCTEEERTALEGAESLVSELGRLRAERLSASQVVAALPPFRRWNGQEIVASLIDASSAQRSLGMPWWRQWLARCDADARDRVATLLAASGHLGELPGGATVLIPDGALDRYSACHWRDALEAWESVVITGLEAHDPSAFDEPVVAALKLHQPVGVRDSASWWLFREFGVEAIVTGRTSRAPSPASGQSLWNDAPLAPAGLTAAIRAALKGAPSRAPETVRTVCNRFGVEPWPPGLSGRWKPPPVALDERIVAHVRRQQDAAAVLLPSAEMIDVALAVDANLAHALPVVIESCLAAASLPIRFHVLTRGLARTDWASCRSLFHGRADISFYPFDDADYGDKLNLIGHTTVSTLDRLLLPLLLSTLNRVIYLDVDLVVLGDLAELWRIDLGGRPLAAKPSSSPGTRWGIQMLYHALGSLPIDRAREIARWLHETGPMTFRAFNAGVLLMDLERMRSDRAVPLLLSLVTNCAMNDQDALNAYARSSYVELSPAWNAAPRQDDTQGAKIIHFVGPVKPWHDLYISRKFEFQRVRDRVDQRRRELGLA